MKAYVLAYSANGCYEEEHGIVGIYSSKQKAKHARKRYDLPKLIESGDGPKYKIVETTMDEACLEDALWNCYIE
ncbi:hypothetical protein [Lactiplantibacillus paraplantarum]|uniref:hypothetical protein n=1 Tax=Lactiplantibacillus paraplantarum TaxID=60520 RepID=UPI002551FAEC|nr:hypothetical protein [Lactiplantibacillus paraplantarum]MDL2061535.1 hypothetical protein [Lactiplantibacillus paraplantarum]